jgi:NADH dehydrogenase
VAGFNTFVFERLGAENKIMTTKVVVLGAGYAGTGAIQQLQGLLSWVDEPTQLVWISETDYHLVLHESHRVISNPDVAEKITVPIETIADDETEFLRGRAVDVDDRTVHLEDGRTEGFDYALVAVGSRTAFYGIPGLEENAHTLNGLEDARAIHEDVASAADAATPEDPATVVVGGGGLSGIQTAGEVAEYRDHTDRPIDVYLVEALEAVLPGMDPELQAVVRAKLDDADVTVLTDDPITEATSDTVYFDEGDPIDYDVFVWTGGITGGEPLPTLEVDKDERSNRVHTDNTFATSDDRVFAIGDSALIDQGTDPAPPTAQAAWQAAELVGENIVRRIEGRPLESWTYEDKGTLISVGEDAIAHDVKFFPMNTFNSYPAVFLKKFVAARWIADVSSWGRAMGAWSDL